MTEQATLSEEERNVLIYIRQLGSGIDFGGRGANRKRLAAARALEKRGLLTDYRNARLTDAGRSALSSAAT